MRPYTPALTSDDRLRPLATEDDLWSTPYAFAALLFTAWVNDDRLCASAY